MPVISLVFEYISQLQTCYLYVTIGKSYGFAGFGVDREFFHVEFDPEMLFGRIAHSLMQYSG